MIQTRWLGWKRIALLVGLGAGLATTACSHRTDYGGIELSAAPLSRTLRGDKLIERSTAAVVTVETDIGRGMGFVIDPAGYIMTNRHVVEDADHLEGVVFPAIDPGHMYESVRIVYIDPVRDLALLHVNAKEPLPYLPLATRNVEPVSRYLSQADPVVLLQRDGGTKRLNPGLIVRRGNVNELAALNPAAGPGAFVGVTNEVVQGQSGGPVLDAHGRAVGVVTWTWRDRVGGYAIPIAEATRMLSERPQMQTVGDHAHRAESRVRTFLDAVAGDDADL
ncbi:MAG: serine protease, partial [Myxococcota bacterium]